MREQGVDQPGLRGEVAAQHGGAAFVAGDFVEQALELGDVAVDRLLEESCRVFGPYGLPPPPRDKLAKTKNLRQGIAGGFGG
jgi:hypothetical protein